MPEFGLYFFAIAGAYGINAPQLKSSDYLDEPLGAFYCFKCLFLIEFV